MTATVICPLFLLQVPLSLKNGINEHYDSITGKPLGVPYNGMTCTVITLMLDGLTTKHTLKLKNPIRKLSNP